MLDKFPLAAGVDRKWFFSEPPPLPNRGKVDPEWQRLFHYVEQHNVGGMEFRPADVFKAWNSAFAGDPCKHNFLRHAPGMLYLYDPPDGEARPPYRYMPDATQPDLAGDQPDGLARRPDRGAARAQDHPHRVRRLLDHRRPAAPALLLSRAGRLLAEPLGRVARSWRCTSRC